MGEPIGVNRMQNVDMMARVGKGAGQAIHIGGIAAEAVRRIESGDVQETERLIHWRMVSCIKRTRSRAAAVHVSRPAAASPARLMYRHLATSARG